MSAMLPDVYPEEDIVYVVSALRSAPPSCGIGSQCLETLLSQNKRIIDITTSGPDNRQASKKNATVIAATALDSAGTKQNESKASINANKVEEQEWGSNKGGMGAKQYLPYWKDECEWRTHFGDKWDHFEKLKETFDPLHVLAPGQRIFTRKPSKVKPVEGV